MKTFHFICCAAFAALLLSGCDIDRIDNSNIDHTDTYWLTINFRDAIGKDLVAPLADERWMMAADKDLTSWPGTINPERYHLDILLSNPHEIWDNAIYNFKATNGSIPDEYRPHFTIAKYNDKYEGTLTYTGDDVEGDSYCYLFSNFMIPAINGLQNTLTYQLICPTIFGDSDSHAIVSYWTQNAGTADDLSVLVNGRPECYSVQFEGREIPVNKVIVHSSEFSTHKPKKEYPFEIKGNNLNFPVYEVELA